MTLSIVKIEPLKPPKYTHTCIYGHPDVGKTTLIGGSPNCLIIRPPVESTRNVRPADRATTTEAVIRNWAGMEEIKEHLIETRGGGFEWVWLDSASLIQDVLLEDVLADAIARKSTLAAREERKKFGADKGEYGINMDRLSSWVRAMVGIDAFNFGFTAHPFVSPTPANDSGEVLLMPYIQGKEMAVKFCGYMNLVGFMEVLPSGQRQIRFGIHERFYGKAPEGWTPKKMVDPTMDKIIEAIGRTTSAPKKAPVKATTRRSFK